METKTAHWEGSLLWSNDGVCLAQIKRSLGWFVECSETSPLTYDDLEFHNEFHAAKKVASELAKAAGYRMISRKKGLAAHIAKLKEQGQ